MENFSESDVPSTRDTGLSQSQTSGPLMDGMPVEEYLSKHLAAAQASMAATSLPEQVQSNQSATAQVSTCSESKHSPHDPHEQQSKSQDAHDPQKQHFLESQETCFVEQKTHLDPPELTNNRNLQNSSGSQVGAVRVRGINTPDNDEGTSFDADLISAAQTPPPLESANVNTDGTVVARVVTDDDMPVFLAQKEDNRKYRRLIVILVAVSLIALMGVAVGIVMAVSPPSRSSSPEKLLVAFPDSSSQTAATFLLSWSENPSESFQSFGFTAETVGLLPYLNQTDINMTILALPSSRFIYLDGVFVGKMASTPWSAHRLLLYEMFIIPDRVLYVEDIANGTEVVNLSGDKMVFTTNPLRVNGAAFGSNIDIPVSNGVVHGLKELIPLPWIRQSIYNELVRVNKSRGGDLSIFLSILEASNDDIPLKVLLQDNGGGPQTLFCPTNAAWEGMFPQTFLDDAIVDGVASGSMLEILLDNHMSLVNFVRDYVLVGLVAEEEDGMDVVVLRTLSGNDLRIVVDGAITINSDVVIVQEDILNEYGVIQVIDGLLLPPGMNVSTL